MATNVRIVDLMRIRKRYGFPLEFSPKHVSASIEVEKSRRMISSVLNDAKGVT